MHIHFSWKYDIDRYLPCSSSDFLYQDGVSLLDCILMDSGGQQYSDTIPWLEEGIRGIDAVKSQTVESYDWGRETWAALCESNQAKIYSLYDEEYNQIMSLEGFAKALMEWKSFLQRGMPTETLDLSIEV